MSLSLRFRSPCAAALLCLSPVAAAQEQPLGGPPAEVLNDLAETLGQAHAVRAACNGDSDQTWRNYMMNLLAIEAPSGPRRSSMTSAFNRGYRSQNSRTSTCTSDMPRIEAEIAARGRALAETAANSYLH
jgi:uncharacterized protein (TIGR02301 family)